MNTYDTCNTARIVRQAREMRALELQRIGSVLARRARLQVRLLAVAAADAVHGLRSLLSSNPQAHRS